MSEFDWATADASATVDSLQVIAPPMRGLVDFDAPGTAPLPPLPEQAVAVDEPLVAIDHPQIRCLNLYQRHGFPATIGQCYVRAAVNRRLAAVAEDLPEPFGLAVFDAWRDPRLQQFLYDRCYADPAMPPGFVSPPSSNPATPPPHSTGGTVDLTLTWNGTPLALGTSFDEFTEEAFTDSLEGLVGETRRVDRELRRMLLSAMHRRGFVVLAREWWHFEYGTRLWSAVLNRPARYPQAPRPQVDLAM
jgi:zinc D-Ala-D-Ala dipeptidase